MTREDIEAVGAEVARGIWLLQAVTAVERWEADTGKRHPWNPGGGDWSHTVDPCPLWVNARAVKVMASTAREAEAQHGPGASPLHVWETDTGARWAWSVAMLATGDGGGEGWANNPPPDFGWRKLASDVELRIRVTRNTVHCPRPVRS